MPYLIIAVIGILGGLVGGLFGVGGGLIFVPLLILIKNFDPHVAIGTSFAAIIPTAAIGAYRHYAAQSIDWKTALFLILFSVIGAWIGAGISLRMDVHLLRRLYAAFLLGLSFKLFFQN